MKTIITTILASMLACGTVQAQSVDVRVETLASGLEHPWSIAFLSADRWLVTERAGRLRIIDDGRLRAAPVSGVPPAYVASQGGLLHVLAAPDFEQSGLIYLSLAHGTPAANATRVVRARLAGDELVDVTAIFTAAPTKSTPVHYGGRMAWLDDGTLLVGLGDGFDYREDAQRLASHTGTVVRIGADGSVPADNPFVAAPGARPEIYTLGHRNVQGLVVDAARGIVFAHEHGPRGGDELNRLEPGANYGWPAVTHGVDYSGALISPYRTLPGYVDPLVHWTPSIAPSGMALYRGNLFPTLAGDLLVTALVERSLRHVELDAAGAVVSQHRIELPLDERLRDVAVAPDGAIVLLTDSPDGKVLRLRPR